MAPPKKIKAAPAVEAQEGEDSGEVEVQKAPKAKALKMYKITFHGEGGDVEIAHNYQLNVYKRNVETTIDENFLGVLRDAVVHTVTKGKEADGPEQHVKIPCYQYTVEPI
jgi:hypothetical protein